MANHENQALMSSARKPSVDIQYSEDEKQRLFSNIAAAMQGVPHFIIERQIKNLSKVDPVLGAGIAKALELQARPPNGKMRVQIGLD